MAELYLYGLGIFDRLPQIETSGVHDLPVAAVNVGDFAALTSAIDADIVESRGKDLRAHNHVLEEAMEFGVVLPVRFGVIVPDKAALERTVREAEDHLLAAANRLRDRCEVSVNAICDEEQMLAHVTASDPELLRLREHVKDLPEDASYFKRIELGERVANEVEALSRAMGDRLFGDLCREADDCEMGRASFPKIFSGHFLVEADKIEDFAIRAREIGGSFDIPLNIDVAGPLPPYSFVDLELAVPAQKS